MKKLLILHGALGSAEQMKPLHSILKKNFDVYTLDFSAHGTKQEEIEKLSMNLFVQDVLEFLNNQHIDEPIALFGYSMGGYVALLLASLYPHKVSSVYTLATKFDWNELSSQKESQMLNTHAIESKVPHFAAMLSQRHGALHWKKLCTHTANLMLSLGKNPVLTPAHLAKIQCPCKLCVGALDKMVSQSETQDVYRQIKMGTFYVYTQMEHPFEKIDYPILAKDIQDFINEKQR